MARPRAADYDDKRATILARAARLFAEKGYDRTSMNEIAIALGVSKALFYHYYSSKDALLFDIIRSHLEELVEATEQAASRPLPPQERLRTTISAILDCYRDADAEHKIQINHLGQLPEAQQAQLRALERRLVAALADIVAQLNPVLDPRFVKPLTMSIFGTLNWKYMWFREDGPVTRDEYVDLITGIFSDGIAAGAGTRAEARAKAPLEA